MSYSSKAIPENSGIDRLSVGTWLVESFSNIGVSSDNKRHYVNLFSGSTLVPVSCLIQVKRPIHLVFPLASSVRHVIQIDSAIPNEFDFKRL